ncbi:hypothetical protein ElyMa_002486800 [Elysia marginata]|uniref:Uncharacterized protein n=1 Tax=Elysia marginata TaxID=1093978 RepID=A0AAV4GS26_9GAST|nr:hypothetical protein ElyMa_002486800 [Elysia marginata]
MINCFPKAIITWHGWESNPQPHHHESYALTILPCCPILILCDVTNKFGVSELGRQPKTSRDHRNTNDLCGNRKPLAITGTSMTCVATENLSQSQEH